VDGAPSASTAWATPEQIARWDAEFAAMAAEQPAGTFMIKVVDQYGAAVPKVPVWIDCETISTSALTKVLGGHSASELYRATILTDARGIAIYKTTAYRSLYMGVVGRELPLPFIAPLNPDDATEHFQGIKTSADSERDIKAGRQAARPHHVTAVVYKIEGQAPTLWSHERMVVELQDRATTGFRPVPLVIFPCEKAFPLRDQGGPKTPAEWSESRRLREEDALPWAHALVQGGVLPSAVTGKPVYLNEWKYGSTPWWLEIQARGADFQLVAGNDRLPLVAPEVGYRSSIRWEVPAQRDDVRQWLWVRIHSNPIRYGCWQMRAMRDSEHPSGKRPAKITLEGPVYVNPTGSRHLERFLILSQRPFWRDLGLLIDPSKAETGKPIPSKVLYPDKPIDVTKVERLPLQTIVIAPPAPQPPLVVEPPPLTGPTGETEEQENARLMAEWYAGQAAASASAAKP